ncbi:Toxin Doc [Candidatus Protochlamydia amoebophila]|uniref:Toxin Doc n=2 Tax=Candidatus Protochlamydia amoebophila TaxID=362787 RepID=A0A0C1GZQ5_9BACT|nr:Toxin Doc [Candidatus Protochlamydia amoebophila]
MRSMIYLSFEQIIELHDALIDKFGGLLGIRERGLLESALAAPMMAVFGVELHKTIYNKAAAYLFYIAKNHAFLDGNKRTAAAAALSFLRANGKSPKYNVEDFLEFAVSVAEGQADLDTISNYFEKICS